MNLSQLTEKQQLDIYTLAHDKTGISQVVLEKDWWVHTIYCRFNKRINILSFYHFITLSLYHFITLSPQAFINLSNK